MDNYYSQTENGSEKQNNANHELVERAVTGVKEINCYFYFILGTIN